MDPTAAKQLKTPTSFNQQPTQQPILQASSELRPLIAPIVLAQPDGNSAITNTAMVLQNADLPSAQGCLGAARKAEDWLPNACLSAFIPDLSSQASYYLLCLATRGSYLLRKSTKHPESVAIYWKSRASEVIKRIAFPETSAAQLIEHLEVLTPAKALIPSVFNFAPEQKLALPQKLRSTAILIGGLHQRYVTTHHYSSFKPDEHQERFPEVKTLVLQGCRFIGGHALQDWVSRFPDLKHLILVGGGFFKATSEQCFIELSPDLEVLVKDITTYHESLSPTGIKYTHTVVDSQIKEALAQRGESVLTDCDAV